MMHPVCFCSFCFCFAQGVSRKRETSLVNIQCLRCKNTYGGMLHLWGDAATLMGGRCNTYGGMLKHLWGDAATFLHRPKGRMVIIYGGMVYAKMFYGEVVLFSGDMAYPLDSNTVTSRLSCVLKREITVLSIVNLFDSNFLKFDVFLSNVVRAI